MTWVVVSDDGKESEPFDSRSEAEDRIDDLDGLVDAELQRKETDGGVESEIAGGNSNNSDTDVVTPKAADELPDEKPSVDTDPLSWVPGDFTDTIDGTVAINRKGFEVICQHYGVSVTTEMIESPCANDWEACIHKATALTEDGVEYSAYGSSHVGRGDDKALLVSMSDTRAYKRAASRATGVGMLAVEELQAASVGGDHQ